MSKSKKGPVYHCGLKDILNPIDALIYCEATNRIYGKFYHKELRRPRFFSIGVNAIKEKSGRLIYNGDSPDIRRVTANGAELENGVYRLMGPDSLFFMSVNFFNAEEGFMFQFRLFEDREEVIRMIDVVTLFGNLMVPASMLVQEPLFDEEGREDMEPDQMVPARVDFNKPFVSGSEFAVGFLKGKKANMMLIDLNDAKNNQIYEAEEMNFPNVYGFVNKNKPVILSLFRDMSYYSIRTVVKGKMTKVAQYQNSSSLRSLRTMIRRFGETNLRIDTVGENKLVIWNFRQEKDHFEVVAGCLALSL